MPTRVTDPESVVKRVAAALRTLRGKTLTENAASCLAELVCQDLPGLDPDDVFEVLSISRVLGFELTEAVIDERARQIATLEMHRPQAVAAGGAR